MKRLEATFVFVLVVAVLCSNAHSYDSYWFVPEKNCVIRSGPGASFGAIGQLTRWEPILIPDSFYSKLDEWDIVPISKDFTQPVSRPNEHWLPLKEKEHKHEKVVVQGWYDELEPGLEKTFIRYVDGEENIEEGCLIKALLEERNIDGTIYRKGEFEIVKEHMIYSKWVSRDCGLLFHEANNIHRYLRIRQSNFPAETQHRILARRVWIGMTKDMALLSWGHPDDINKTVTRHSLREQWVYEEYKNQYLYFENGILTAMRTHH